MMGIPLEALFYKEIGISSPTMDVVTSTLLLFPPFSKSVGVQKSPGQPVPEISSPATGVEEPHV